MHSSLLLRPSTAQGGVSAAARLPALPPSAPTAGHFQSRRPLRTSTSPLQLHAISRHRTEGYIDVIQNGMPGSGIKWHETVEDDIDKDTHTDKIKEFISAIRTMLQSMDDGEITASPYDTAWVAMVEDIGGGGRPQFPSTLDWISDNQLSDGSWGDKLIFSIYDRIINTLACVVALKTWKLHPHKTEQGILFIKNNINKLGDENEEHMPIGFEVALPSLIEIAKKLEIDIPHDSPGLQHIYQKRDLKFARITSDTMHKVPTTLLHSLEGMPGLIWDKILKFQSSDGSFLFSPSATAFAFRRTKDGNCLKYLAAQVEKFNGGVPNVYPVDLFEHLWAVDRLQRLGISRYFQPEIEECMDYVHRYWTAKGISWARNSNVQDIDDTSMGFRLLRLHGYDVSAEVFENFHKRGDFFCFLGQTTQAVTGMYNLYRASQLMFPGENILAQASHYAVKFLHRKRAENDLLDKWIIAKDLPGEVGYALDVPWYASLPRIETRFYLEQYGGEDDVWIGKTLYRMSNVSNNTYLELAKLDYNNCQALHLKEWEGIQKWYKNCNLEEFGLSKRSLIQAYYTAAACVFEPEKAEARLAWAKTAILVDTIISHFHQHQLSRDEKRAFVDEFERGTIHNYANGGRYKTRSSLVGTLLTTLNQLSLDVLLAHGRDIRHQLNHAWLNWLKTWEESEDPRWEDVELIIRTLNLSGAGRGSRSEDHLLSHHPKYQQLLKITTRVCHQLRLFQHEKVRGDNGCVTNTGDIASVEIEADMQELVKLVLKKPSSGDLDALTKQNFLTVARSFYYTAFCNVGTINFHMSKVLFERVL